MYKFSACRMFKLCGSVSQETRPLVFLLSMGWFPVCSGSGAGPQAPEKYRLKRAGPEERKGLADAGGRVPSLRAVPVFLC